MKRRILKNQFLFFLCIAAAVLWAGCSINQMAMRMSPEAVGPSIPKVIQKNEARLAKKPDDQALILETGSLYVMYANAFVQGPAEFLPPLQYQERIDALEEAQKLYLRGADILYDGLNRKYPGFAEVSSANNTLDPYLAKMEKDDVPNLYWVSAGYLSAYSLDPFNLKLGRRAPDLMFYIDRAYALDPDFNSGALDDFYVLALSSLPEPLGGDKTRVDTHFKRALEKAGGKLAGPYVSYAQSVSIPNQDYPGFKKYLEAALAINSKKNTSNRLVNTISQRKARSLLDNALDYFIDLEEFDSEDGNAD
ncbi:MAG: TRAP transporter TatT component family protein [Treponema sp.]|jgi:predicted anti-sigma-YlaC factor YlaD|nr:TRAP transporter TatT component family protein [Treponema sp.]